MMLAELFPSDHVFVMRPADKDAALAGLSRRAADILAASPSEIAAALAAREALGSTGVGAGVAVPHARLATLAAAIGFFARLERPIEWGAIDRRPVDLVFLLLSPAGSDADHLAALAAGTRRLRDAATAARLRTTSDTASLRTTLLG